METFIEIKRDDICICLEELHNDNMLLHNYNIKFIARNKSWRLVLCEINLNSVEDNINFARLYGFNTIILELGLSILVRKFKTLKNLEKFKYYTSPKRLVHIIYNYGIQAVNHLDNDELPYDPNYSFEEKDDERIKIVV